MAQDGDITISGTVMAQDGETLPSVSIKVKDANWGVVSDVEGHFVLTRLKAGATVVFSYIGFESQELTVSANKDRLRIALKESANEMEEVLVVAHGTQRKISVVGAITNIKPSELQIPATSVSNMLGGRVPGIISVTRSGEPGSDFSEFWVRGISTFGAGQSALILIDGVDGNLNDLDPADIESFTVLKDASSTAVYGVRGANGVVLVTTNKGKAGQMTVNLKSNVGLSHSPRMPEYLNAGMYARLANEAAISRGMPAIYDDIELGLFASGLDPDLYPNVNWRDVMLKEYTWNQQHHLSISGGGTNARYYMSLGILNKDAVFKQDVSANKYNTNVDYNKYNFRANIDANLTNTTILTLGLESVIITQNSPGYGDDNTALWLAQAGLTPVSVPVEYSSGQLPAYGANSNQISPYVLLNHTGYKKFYRNSNNLNVRLNQSLSMITEGLDFTLLYSLNSNSSLLQQRLKSPDLYHARGRLRNGALDLIQTVAYSDPVYGRETFTDRKIYFEGRVNYQRTFGDHRVTGLVHYYMDDYITSDATDDIQAIPKRYIGLSGRLTYSYKDTYMLEGNIGYTGSETFAKGQKFGAFPAVSIGWAPTQYEWIQENVKFINFLKFRGSVGLVGNDRIGGSDNASRFPYLTTMTTTSGSNLWGGRPAITEELVGTDNLRWEKSTKYNLGIDMHFFKSRFDLTIDFFKDIRSGIFQKRASIPEEMGLVQIPWANVGSMKSWGSDGNISYTQPFGNKSALTVRANMTYSKNTITSFEETGIRYPYQSAVGYRYGISRGLIALGLFEDEDDIINSPRQIFNSQVLPGDIKYKDVNGDGLINDDDIVPIEYSNVPEFQYGFAAEYSWKNWAFSFFFEGVENVNFFYGGSGYYPFAEGYTGNVLSIVGNQNNRWTPESISGTKATENPNARFPRLSYGANANNNRASTFYLSDGSYLRLKNVEISYDLKLQALRILGIQSIRLSAIGENLHCWDMVKLWDPAQASNNGAVYPLQRIYTLQMNIKF
jgi:TonB-linked SusC/RagA family outer membrane protein